MLLDKVFDSIGWCRSRIALSSLCALLACFAHAEPLPSWSPAAILNSTAAIDHGEDSEPDIASDGNGTCYAVWQSDHNSSPSAPGDSDIYLSRSTDQCATWSTATLISTYPAMPSHMDAQPQVACDHSGNVMVAWQSYQGHSTVDPAVDFAVSHDGAAWSPRMHLSTQTATETGTVVGTHELITNCQGTWLAAWTLHHSGFGSSVFDRDICFSRSTDNGTIWSAPQPFDTSTTSPGVVSTPCLAYGPGGVWLAVWDSNQSTGGTYSSPRALFCSRSTDDGLHWSPPEAIPAPSGSNYAPRLVRDGTGKWVIVWMWRSGPYSSIRVYSSSSADLGVHWTSPVTVCESIDEGYVLLVADSAGNLAASWVTEDTVYVPPFGEEQTVHNLRASRSADSGASWSGAAILETADSGYETAVAANAGNLFAVAWSNRGETGADSDIYCARSLDNGQTWQAPATVNDYAKTDSGYDRYPSIATDRQGNWLVGWQSDHNLNGQYATETEKHLLLARSTDNGGSWTPVNVVDYATTTGHTRAREIAERGPQVYSDGRGGWKIVGSRYAIDAAGSPADSWQEPRCLPVPLYVLQAATDDAGHWCVTGYTYGGFSGNPDSDCFACSSLDNGTTWSTAIPLNSDATEDGAPSNSACGNDINPRIATDGTGHWVAVWEYDELWTQPAGTDGDIAVARSSDNGLHWTPMEPLTDNDWCEHDPVIATDDKGQWVAAWNVDSPLFQIATSCSSDNGATWSAPVFVPGLGVFGLHLVTDRKGYWVLSWDSVRDPQGTMASYSTDNGRTWSELQSLPTGWNTHIAADENGHWVAVGDDNGGLTGSEILVSRSSFVSTTSATDWTSLY